MVPTLQDLILVHNITYKEPCSFFYVIIANSCFIRFLFSQMQLGLHYTTLPITKAPYNLVNLNCCPPTDASYMSPPFCIVNTITPSAYFTFAEAQLLRHLSCWLTILNRSISFSDSKKPLPYACAPAWNPMLSCDNFANLPAHYVRTRSISSRLHDKSTLPIT
jgi:hypothetical protein